MHSALEHFFPELQSLPSDRSLTKQDLLTETFLMNKDENLEMYYAPHNEYVNDKAKVVIAGITPGWGQMKAAYEQFVKSITFGDNLDTCLKKTKMAARFAGSMRANLTSMLDQCDIPRTLGIPHSSDLFEKRDHLLHTTSIIKYPVFTKGGNYTGHRPKIHQSPLLQHYAYEVFPEELTQITPPALIIPLGKSVEQVILKLAEERKLFGHTYLIGFPHPSGANGHRIKQFQQEKEQLQKSVRTWGLCKNN